jgi:hypothetical protein
MTDKPAPTPPREPLRLPPNFRDVTAEKIGTVMGVVGATGCEGNEARSAGAGLDAAHRAAAVAAIAPRAGMMLHCGE